MLPFQYQLRDFTHGDVVPVEDIRSDLRLIGVSVVRLYSEEDAAAFEQGMDALAAGLREDGGTAHGSRGMGGIVKIYGAACHPAAARVRTDPRARMVHAQVYGLDSDQVMSGWDAVACVGQDAARTRPPTAAALQHPDAQKAYFALTGGTLEPHVDIGVDTYGSRMEERMRELHPDFPWCVQSQFVCASVPRGGSTFVFSPGPVAEPDPRLFDVSTGRDFCVCTPAGYEHFRDRWRAVEAPRGCLILWLSRTPHGNKLADAGVDPKRRGVYVAWQARELVPDVAERQALKRKKLDAVYAGGSTDHWATHVPKVHKGSHYSNGKGVTKVMYSAHAPPVYDEELTRRIEEAF